jgi:site-specific DNA recombinase
VRALIVVRLSRLTDSTISPERQLQACRDLCPQRGYEVVGIAEDLDVSGAVDPFDPKKRRNLSRWLAGEHVDDNGSPVSFDVIVAFRVDRLTRSIRHLRNLVDWADDHGKLVVSATEPHFDMSSPVSAVLTALIGTVAEMELEAIRDRNSNAFRHNIKAGKYRGGIPPWGYLPDQDDSGTWRLIQDSEQVKVIREVVEARTRLEVVDLVTTLRDDPSFRVRSELPAR